ncbi:hypothetical protein BsWGS_13889 [Bradybaena similaris]
MVIPGLSVNSTEASESDSAHSASEVDSLTYKPVLLGPEWTEAKQRWGFAWEMHVYFLGGLFVLAEMYSIVNVVRFWRAPRLLPSAYSACLHVMLACVCITRAVYLLYCGYDSEQTYHISLNHFLYTIPFPCLTSGFSVIFSWILRAADLHLLPFSLLKLQVLVPIIVIHYILTIITDVLVGYSEEIHALQFVSHAFLIIWGLYLFFGYTYIFRKLYSQVGIGQAQLGRLSYRASLNQAERLQRKLALRIAVKSTFLTAACGLAVTGLEAYAVVDVYTMFRRAHPKPWPWWLYHSILRLLEFFMCLTMSYIIFLPVRYPLPGRKSLSHILCGLGIFCFNYKESKPNISERWRFFRQCFRVNSGNRNNSNGTEYSSTRYHSDEYSDIIQMVQTPSQLCDKPNSLVIVDDVYVRFETDHDINRIVDSCNEFSRRPGAFHQTSRFTYSSEFANNLDVVDNGVKEENYSEDPEINVGGSVGSIVSNSEMCRARSSMSIAESMEKELIRVFENFKADETDIGYGVS